MILKFNTDRKDSTTLKLSCGSFYPMNQPSKDVAEA